MGTTVYKIWQKNEYFLKMCVCIYIYIYIVIKYTVVDYILSYYEHMYICYA